MSLRACVSLTALAVLFVALAVRTFAPTSVPGRLVRWVTGEPVATQDVNDAAKQLREARDKGDGGAGAGGAKSVVGM